MVGGLFVMTIDMPFPTKLRKIDFQLATQTPDVSTELELEAGLVLLQFL
jgi:hypothetical protein